MKILACFAWNNLLWEDVEKRHWAEFNVSKRRGTTENGDEWTFAMLRTQADMQRLRGLTFDQVYLLGPDIPPDLAAQVFLLQRRTAVSK